MQKIVLTQDAARRIVAAGSTSRNVCRQTLDASPKTVAPSRVNDARPVKITSEWTEASSGVWRADARFVRLDGSESDATLAVFRYATQPPPPAVARIAFVVWRGRWKLVSASSEGGLSVGVVEALGAEPHYYIVRDVATNALVEVYDWIGWRTSNGITLLVGQAVVFDYSETLNRNIVLNASPL